jgi:uncharacterized membrane protein YdbT with pleckstrin-like domain
MSSVNEIQQYLLPTETPVVCTRRHWASLTRQTLMASGVLVFAVFTLSFLGGQRVFSWIGTIALLGGIAWYAWVVADWNVERFVITDKRVLLVTGLIGRRVAIMPLNRVTDLTYERSIVGRLFGYGVFVMESAGQHQALSRIDYLPTPDKLYLDVSMLLFGPPVNRRVPGRPPAADQATSPLPPL